MDAYEIGTALSIEHTLENADAILIVVVDDVTGDGDNDGTGNGQEIKLSIQRAEGAWIVRQKHISMIVDRRIDDWIPDSSKMIPVVGTGLDALATALAAEYDADRYTILRILQEHDNACQAAMAAKEV
jgi:hypothetical protein